MTRAILRFRGVGQYLIGALFLLAGLTVVLTSQLKRSLWLDEAWVVEYALEETLADTWQATMANRQPAAAGYMALEHWLSPLATLWPAIFRLPSILSALALLLGILVYVSRLWRSVATGVTVAMGILLCPLFQHYAMEVKEYMAAASVTVWLCILTRWYSDRVVPHHGGSQVGSQGDTLGDQEHRSEPDSLASRGGNGSLIAWFAVASMAVVMTLPGVFALAASTSLLIMLFAFARRLHAVMRFWGACAMVALLGMMHYFTYLRWIAGSDALHQYWANDFLRASWMLPMDVWVRLQSLLASAWDRYPSVPSGALVVAALAGWMIWFRRDWITSVVALGSIVLPIVANLLRFWPLVDRVNISMICLLNLSLLMLIPAVVVRVMEILTWLVALPGAAAPHQTLWMSSLGRVMATNGEHGVLWGLSVCLLLVVVKEAINTDGEVSSVGPLLDQVAARATTQDVVVLDEAAYVNNLVIRRAIAGSLRRGPWLYSPSTFFACLEELAPSTDGTLWILISHTHDQVGRRITELSSTRLSTGKLELRWTGKNVGLYAFLPQG